MRKILLLSILVYTLPLFSHAQSVDLLWQGETYTPPFYKGLPVWTNQAKLTFYAVPNVPGANASSLTYRWTKNGTILGNISGIGMNSLSFSDTILTKPVTIKIDIFRNEDVVASREITLAPAKAEVIVYESNPLYGLMTNNVVGKGSKLKDGEITLAGIPLFFSAAGRLDPAIEYEWRSSGALEKKPGVTYRAPDGVSGESRVALHIFHTDKVMQDAEANFSVKFGN